MHARWTGLAAALAVLMGAVATTRAASVVNTFGSWTLYRDDSAGVLCFLAESPSQSLPAGVNRDAPLLYVSAWVKDGVKAEISVRLGFPAKKANEPMIGVSGRTGDVQAFKLFVKDDRAFVADPTQELKLIEAMKKGSQLTVQATSERGTAVIDTYPLSGFTAALQALAGGCG